MATEADFVFQLSGDQWTKARLWEESLGLPSAHDDGSFSPALDGSGCQRPEDQYLQGSQSCHLGDVSLLRPITDTAVSTLSCPKQHPSNVSDHAANIHFASG